MESVIWRGFWLFVLCEDFLCRSQTMQNFLSAFCLGYSSAGGWKNKKINPSDIRYWFRINSSDAMVASDVLISILAVTKEHKKVKLSKLKKKKKP